MSLTFDALDHVYTLDGAVVPSVTGVLKASGLIDFSHIPPPILEAARVRGSRVHAALHYLNEHDLDWDTVPAEDRPRIKAWETFCVDRGFTPVLNEYRIASRHHRIAGTLDCLGTFRGGQGALVDFKCGRPDDVAADLQTAAYLMLAQEWARDGDARLRDFFEQHPVIHRYAVQLRKDGSYQVAPYTDPRDYSCFATLVAARRIVEARKGEGHTWAA